MDRAVRLTAVVTHEDDWYVARAPEVEVASQERTVEEALANLREALELCFEDEHFEDERLRRPRHDRRRAPPAGRAGLPYGIRLLRRHCPGHDPGRAQAVCKMSRDGEPSVGASPEELARFYEEHDLTALDPGERVEAQPAREPMVSRSVRFDRETMQRLRAVAARRGTGVTQLMRGWIVDRLEAEETGRHRSEIAAELERLARELRASA